AAGALAPGDTVGFSFPGAWNRAVYGPHRLRVWVTTAANQPDGVVGNDSLISTVQVASREVPRRVLQELATSSTCPPCATYEDSLRTYDRRHPGRPVERIAYPMNFPGPGDPYYLPEFRARALDNLHNVRSIYLYQQLGSPLMIANGYFYVDATDRFTAPPVPPFDSLMTVLETPPAYVELTGTCRVGGDTIRGAITLTPTRFLPGRAYTLYLVVTERRTTDNATTNGQTEFYDVAKKIILTRQLTADLLPEQPLSIPYSYVFPAGHTVEHFDSLEVVAFVQFSRAFGTALPAEVIQVARIGPGRVLGTAAPAPTLLLTAELAPNPVPAAEFTTVHLTLPAPAPVTLTVLDALGRVVLTQPVRQLAPGRHALLLALPGATPGLYLVQLTAGAQVLTRRLAVQ
ncbi:MAG: T9SS type A sorting domain-containing protein, partial [Hymenobacteraceae bacterium]|nr:T9SS type A sorting domain-containing protein [Hymenobacteraceae bacterium]